MIFGLNLNARLPQGGGAGSGGALRFVSSAANNSCVIPDSAAYVFNRVLSLQFKFNPSRYQADSAIVSKAISTSNPFDVRYTSSNGRLLVACYDGTHQPQTITTLTDVNKYYDCLYTRDGTTCSLYIGGTLIVSTPDTTIGTTDNLLDITLGRRTGSAQWFDGCIDDVRIWNITLSAAQAEDLALYGMVPRTGLVGEWLFDEMSGTTAFDTSGNGNDGTILNATYTTGAPLPNVFYRQTFENAPPFTAFQTSSGRWIDGTATGATTRTPYKLWASFGAATGDRNIGFDSANPHTGRIGLKIHINAGAYGEVRDNAMAYYAADGYPIAPSTTYNYSVWMKSENCTGDTTSGQTTVVLCSDASGVATGSFALTPTIKTNIGWTKYTGTFTTPANTAWFHPEFRAYGHTGVATLSMDAYFDDLVIYT